MENIMDTLITDRTQADVDRARYLNGLWDPRALQWRGTPQERAEWEAGPRGAYGFADMNRVTQAAAYLIGKLEELGYSVDIEDVTPAYSIRVGVEPAGGGVASGAGVYYEGDTATVTAQAGEKYDFVGWMESGKLVSEDADYTFAVNGPRSLTALFALKKFQVTVSVDPSGAGEATGAGTYDIDTEVTVVASAGEGYVFTRWAENGQPVADGPEYTFTLDRDRALSAVMTKTHVISVTANDEDGGTVSGGGIYLDGQTVTVAAVAGEGYEFAGWSENGAVVSEEAVYTFQAAADRELEAVFVKTYVITLLVDPAEGGAALGGGTYREGERVAISATAGDGYRFVSWQSGGEQVSASNPYTLTVTGDQTLTALFEEIPVYTITVSIDPEGSGTVTGAGQYREGATVVLTASPADGYNFSGWQEGGQTVGTNTTYSFTVTADGELVAAFEEKVSRLPAGYTEVQYIQINDTAYINSGLYSNYNTGRYVLDVDINYNSGSLLYCAAGSAKTNFQLGVNSSTQLSYRIALSSTTFISVGNTQGRHLLDWDFSKKAVIVDGKSYTIMSASGGTGTPVQIWAMRYARANLYSAQFYNGTTLQRDFVPCKNPSGVVGLYDLVNGVFYSPTGGTATAGPAV